MDAPSLPISYRETLLAHFVGYGAVRDRPLSAHEFSIWWYNFERYHLTQSKEGREWLRTLVHARKLRVDGAGTNAEQRRVEQLAANTPVDGVADAGALFANPARLLAILPPDDPRAVYLRAGGRIDARGNPLLGPGGKILPEAFDTSASPPPLAPLASPPSPPSLPAPAPESPSGAHSLHALAHPTWPSMPDLSR